MKKIFIILSTVSIISCGGSKEDKKVEVKVDESNCYLAGENAPCYIVEGFEEVRLIIEQLDIYTSEKYTYNSILKHNDSVLKLLVPMQEVIEKAKEINESYASTWLTRIDEINEYSIEWKKKAEFLNSLVLKGELSYSKKYSEKVISYSLENHTDYAFEMLTLTTKFYDKDNVLIYTDENDAIGSYDFMPRTGGNFFPAKYKGSLKASPILGPEEDIVKKVEKISQQVTNVTFK